jgi:hypothetical protein
LQESRKSTLGGRPCGEDVERASQEDLLLVRLPILRSAMCDSPVAKRSWCSDIGRLDRWSH